MRAKEFIVNISVPVTISMNADGTVDVKHPNSEEETSDEVGAEQPVMVPPLQQKIELMKANAGKSSEVIDQLTDDDSDDFTGFEG